VVSIILSLNWRLEVLGGTRPRQPCIPYTGGGIHGGLRIILQKGIRCAITLITPLAVAALRSGAAQSDPLRGPAHRDLHDFVRGQYGD
jgi:hypothetical protein